MCIGLSPSIIVNFFGVVLPVTGLVQGVSVAAAQLCKLMHQSLHNAEYEESTIHSKFISRTLTGSLSPALYHLLSDGLLPSVTTLFGQVTNSIWRVVEASVKKGILNSFHSHKFP